MPFPSVMDRGAGGQYSQGTGYVFHSTHLPDPLSITGGHEYFHAYNDGALEGTFGSESWFIEGYTELQATLQHLQRSYPPGKDISVVKWRAEHYKRDVATCFATMTQPEPFDLYRRLEDAELLTPIFLTAAVARLPCLNPRPLLSLGNRLPTFRPVATGV